MSHTLSLPVVRFSLAGLLSLLMTFFLFFFMQNLITNTGEVYVEETSPIPEIDFVRVERPEIIKPRERVTPPTEIEDPPPALPEKTIVDPNIGRTPVIINPVDTTVPGGRSGPGTIAIGDGDILPVLKVRPNYPRSALIAGTEGYVIVEFTVTTTGATRDIMIVEAEPDNIFNRASIQAAEKFKYKPRVIDGTPVEVRGIRNKFIFKLE